MNLAKSMAEVNQLLYDPETLHLYTKCPAAQEMGSRHLMTESHEWLMISKWLKQHMVG